MTKPMLDLVVERLRHRLNEADELVQAFAEWLGVFDLGANPVGNVAGLWTSRDVAVAGLREAGGRATARPFESGLNWLRRREFFRPHVVPVFEADPLAILAVSLGVRHTGDTTARQWIAAIAKRAAMDETDSWRSAMLAGALVSVEAGSLNAPAELIVALATQGIGSADAATRQAAFAACLELDDVPGERAAARLAALSRSSTSSIAELMHPPAAAENKLMNQPKRHRVMNILLLASNPTTTDQNLLDEEVRAIEEKIGRAEHRERVHFVPKFAVRPDDLHLAFIQVKPTVVHFSGHGAGHLGIVFHGDVPGTDYQVPGEALKHLFATLKGDIRVVVLNACESSEQAKLIVEVIDFVIGMGDTIDDESARRFAAAFYLGISSGMSVHVAFQMGISAVKLHGLPDSDVPQLYVRPGVSADEVLVRP